MRNIKFVIDLIFIRRHRLCHHYSHRERKGFFCCCLFYQNSIDQRVKNSENKLTTYKQRISKHWRWWIRLWHFVKETTFSKISHTTWSVAHEQVHTFTHPRPHVHRLNERMYGGCVAIECGCQFNRINNSLVRNIRYSMQHSRSFMGYPNLNK